MGCLSPPGFCFFFKGNEGIVNAMERIQDHDVVIDRLETSISRVFDTHEGTVEYFWKPGKAPPFDYTFQRSGPRPSSYTHDICIHMVPTYAGPQPDPTHNSSDINPAASHVDSQPGETQNSMA